MLRSKSLEKGKKPAYSINDQPESSDSSEDSFHDAETRSIRKQVIKNSSKSPKTFTDAYEDASTFIDE